MMNKIKFTLASTWQFVSHSINQDVLTNETSQENVKPIIAVTSGQEMDD